MQGVRRDFMDMPECAVQKLFVMRCQMHVWRNLVYSQPRNIFVKRDVKLTEPPDAEPHVRWCERSAAKAASYSIKLAFCIRFVLLLEQLSKYSIRDGEQETQKGIVCLSIQSCYAWHCTQLAEKSEWKIFLPLFWFFQWLSSMIYGTLIHAR